ncbi:MAG: hypothetical protein LW720_14730 [Pirellula sp.]|jgi:hypothetical protein|nr:hypothetical protein [Pirellula sp.]
MNRLESFLIGLASGIATLYLVMHFTLVRGSDGFHFIPKLNAKLDVPYEDVRDFQAEHWHRRPALTMSILRARKGHLIDQRTQRSIQKTTQQMISQARSVHHAGPPSVDNATPGPAALLAGHSNPLHSSR